jgi:malto-oligosyltrehalose synthase
MDAYYEAIMPLTKTTPVSTYRIQFHSAFTFADAERVIPYLHDLGITHLYASPIFAATKGSQHGYDVVDPTILNPELLPERFEPMVAALHERGMALVVDIVPNHMGVATNDNPWWNDVLAKGKRSKYAAFFDIDFDHPPRPELVGKVLLPTLGEAYGTVLEKGELKLVHEGGRYAVAYYDRRFPIDPDTEPRIERFGGGALAHFNSAEGRDDLHDLLEAQNWRLAHWTLSSREMNYRRFFDVSDLAALQMQRPGVFEETHGLLLRLIKEGKIAAVRVDHPDGLYDPQRYFEQLQEAYAATGAGPGQPLYVAAEKILAMHEPLPGEWPIAGTSGYDFLIHVNSAFVDPAGEAAMTTTYAEFTGDHRDFKSVALESKLVILDQVLSAELDALTRRLERIAERDRVWRDVSRYDLKRALRAVLAMSDLYRPYITRSRVTEDDVAYVKRATKRVRKEMPDVPPAALELIEATLLRTHPADEALRDEQSVFAARFQQLTAPVTAKGIEDTAFYRYHRLISLNEVGGEPAVFGIDDNALHAYFADRQRHWPLSMSTLSTHDTKRSEDVRARLNALSELPQDWAAAVNAWHAIATRDAESIRPADAYLVYQTLLGAWSGTFDETFGKRIHAYVFKALREGKDSTSWVQPNTAYEQRVTAFIDGLLKGREFYSAFEPFARRVAGAAMINSLAQTALKFTAPGVADTYQGTELWDLSLVDPDNRRPVDYAARAATIAAPADPATADWPSGAVKLLLTQRLLRLRREHADLLTAGDYLPLKAEGPRAQNVFAFARVRDGKSLLVVVPRLVARWVDTRSSTPRLPDNFWAGTRLSLPANAAGLSDVLSDGSAKVASGQASLADLLQRLPLAVLKS